MIETVGKALTVILVVTESLQLPLIATKRIIKVPLVLNVLLALVEDEKSTPFSFH